ncbi:MAG: TetR/AcrR family transcriptional regulator [Acidimicrobiales bacterium]
MTTETQPETEIDELDPRVARSRSAIIESAAHLLLDGGVHATTVDAIAERAGVSKATIYRHWDSRQQLILDALHHIKPVHSAPDTGSLRTDLIEMVTGLAEHLASPSSAAFTSMAGAAEHEAELAVLRQEYNAERRSPAEAVIARAIDRGELPTDLDVDLFLATVVGPMFYRRVVQGRSVPPHWGERAVDAALAAYGSVGPAGSGA